MDPAAGVLRDVGPIHPVLALCRMSAPASSLAPQLCHPTYTAKKSRMICWSRIEIDGMVQVEAKLFSRKSWSPPEVNPRVAGESIAYTFLCNTEPVVVLSSSRTLRTQRGPRKSSLTRPCSVVRSSSERYGLNLAFDVSRKLMVIGPRRDRQIRSSTHSRQNRYGYW